MSYSERTTIFDCETEQLLGIVSEPATPTRRGVLILVGGAQYRIGSHRHFTLLARALAENGIAAMRFDYRGLGDSSGVQSDEVIDVDIRVAIDAFFREVASLREVIIWGLCGAASAALIYAADDDRVTGVAMANPWVRTAATEARAYVKHYYTDRLLQRDLWKKIARGEFRLGASAMAFMRLFAKAFLPSREQAAPAAQLPLPERMCAALERYSGSVLLLLSGNDLTAKEFLDVVTDSPRWRRLLQSARVARHDFPKVNHTFSRVEWRNAVNSATIAWVRSLLPP